MAFPDKEGFAPTGLRAAREELRQGGQAETSGKNFPAI